MALLADRQIAKDKEAALRVVSVLEAVEGRYDGAAQGIFFETGRRGLVVWRAVFVLWRDQPSCENEIGALEEIAVGVSSSLLDQLNDGWRVDGLAICASCVSSVSCWLVARVACRKTDD